MSFSVAVDVGGTFTDLVAFDHGSGQVLYTKSPTTYGNLAEGILSCLEKVRLAPRDITLVNHGTTLVINSLIQRVGAKTALVTSAGFRDIIEIARGNRPDPFDLHYQRDAPLIARNLRFEARERVDSKGTVIEPLDEDGLIALAARLGAMRVEAVAIFFINSYINPEHEERAAALLRRLLPGVFVTFSTELTREWYEYERSSTVVANGFVGPQVNGYVRNLERELQTRAFDGALYMMGSNGGLLSVERACRQPIALVESGPIGGCIGAGKYAEALGFKTLITFDMGGTTAKCALVEEGRFSAESIYYAGGYVRGFPIKSPVIDIVEVGSGGGSIATVDTQARLHVGPQSAGSMPGPVCYGCGGTDPTVTDANLVLGRLDPANFLGGEITLDRDAATRAIVRRIAAPLGYFGAEGGIRMAEGIVSIATIIMAGAIRRISVEHGRDPREFVLFSYGGGGPLHAAALARELFIPLVVIPPEPGNFSATGMLLADARLDDSTTCTEPLDEASIGRMEQAFGAMEERARAALAKEFHARHVDFERHVAMRFCGQRHNIRVPVSGLRDFAAIRAAFESDYRRRYGHADAKAAAEFQALHLTAFARLHRPEIVHLPRPTTARKAKRSRPVHFASAIGMLDTPVFDRYALASGFSADGPAVIEEYSSTTLVWPGDRFEIGSMREIRIHCSRG